MAFIIKKRSKYYELVENKRVNWVHKRKLLYYMWLHLSIPQYIIIKYNITDDNIQRLKQKHQYLKII